MQRITLVYFILFFVRFGVAFRISAFVALLVENVLCSLGT